MFQGILRALRARLQSVTVPLPLFNAVFSLLTAGIYNIPLWKFLSGLYPLSSGAHRFFFLCAFVTLAAFFYICLSLLPRKGLHKGVACFLIVVNSALLYFMLQYSILIDTTMVDNALQTDMAEALELMSAQFFAYLLLLGVLPAALICALRVAYPQNLRQFLRHGMGMLAAFFLFAAAVFAGYQNFASTIRNHKEVRQLILPNNYIYAGLKVAKRALPDMQAPPAPPAPVAKLDSWQARKKKTLFVFVVGEAARAGNFSLNGYDRDTNPELAKLGVTSFTDVMSCGTNTAVSVPCMFSPKGRKDYKPSTRTDSNNLLKLIGRAGIPTLWIDNNSSCKGVCDGTPGVTIQALAEKYGTGADKNDTAGETHDEAMLKALDDAVAGSKGDLFVVLHQKGSHGPAYYQRVPQGFGAFAPVCKTAELQNCTRDEIRNSYDNTILYTDRFLAGVIGRLQPLEKDYNVAMLYVADHGESLGENNVYLHGMPYMIAPEFQKHVPLILWRPASFDKAFGIDAGCLRKKTHEAFSHDNIFHSILDILDLSTPLKDEKQSIFDGCRIHENS
jgi:lipid A ethanolaminephosphotransferase